MESSHKPRRTASSGVMCSGGKGRRTSKRMTGRMHAGSTPPFLRTLHIVAWAIHEHLGATSCACDGGIINKPRQEVEAALRAIDPHARIEEVNHAGTPLVVYSGSIPGAGEYTFAVEAESMVRAELRQRAAMNN